MAAYRFPYLLAGDSLVLKQKSKYYEFFYNDLIPETHYVLVKRDLSDLVDKIKWAKTNDRIALNISKTARQFTRDNLLPQHVFCYYSVLLQVGVNIHLFKLFTIFSTLFLFVIKYHFILSFHIVLF